MNWEKTHDGRLVEKTYNYEIKAVQMENCKWAVLGFIKGKRIKDDDYWEFDAFCQVPAYNYTSKYHAQEYIDTLFELTQKKCTDTYEDLKEKNTQLKEALKKACSYICCDYCPLYSEELESCSKAFSERFCAVELSDYFLNEVKENVD